jgi:hypothetical protein
LRFKKTIGLVSIALGCCLPALPEQVSCTGVTGNLILNCSFEVNNLTGTYAYSTDGIVASPWTFSGNLSGISRSDGPWGNGVTNGSYAAFLQTGGADNGTSAISQSLTLLVGTTYDLIFDSAQRQPMGSTSYLADPYSVSFNGVTIGTVSAAQLTTTPATFEFIFSTSNTGISTANPATSGLLTFTATGAFGGDLDSTLDNVSLVGTPEPASVLLGAPVLALFALRRRRSGSRKATK